MKVKNFSDLPEHIQKMNKDKLKNATTASTIKNKGIAKAIHDKYTSENLEGLRNDLKRSFVLPIDLKNDNDGRTKHYGISAKRRKDYEKIILALQGKQTPPDYVQNLTITRILGKKQRLFDPDSVLRGSSKELVDSLKACGFFHDDSCKWLNEVLGKQDATQRKLGPAVKIELSRHREERAEK